MANRWRPDVDPVADLGPSRSRVLSVLQDAGRSLGVGEIAEQVSLHANTVRFHLDALVEAGLAERATEDREQPGRPRALYTARAGSSRGGQRSYQLLAEILASYVAAQTPKPAEAGLAAGQAWGRYLAERPPPFRRVEPEAAIQQLVGVLDDVGFAPAAAAEGREILLRQCPFRETAQEHSEVVCSVHLGLMQGLLAELDTPVQVDRLDPFVTPHLCVARLAGLRLD